MTLRTRLTNLERRTRPRPTGRLTMQDWLDIFEQLGQEGYFQGEPDFDEAISCFRAEVMAGEPRCPSWDWVGSMYERISKGLPPVTEREYGELAAWYLRHEHRKDIFDVNIRYYLGNGDPRGVRTPYCTPIVARLRRMRARHPELE
jgi:hypothetical protein